MAHHTIRGRSASAWTEFARRVQRCSTAARSSSLGLSTWVMDDGVVLVHVEAAGQGPSGSVWVRARSRIGTVVALWKGEPVDVGGQHRVEWTGDEDIAWQVNTWPAFTAAPEPSSEGDQITFRGQLDLTEDGAAFLNMGEVAILFDLADPPPPRDADATWVDVRVARDSVTLWPYHL